MNMTGIWMRRVENLIAFSALTVLLGSVLWGVLTRYVTESPAVWTTELSGIMFTWVVYIGAMTAMRDNRHIRVTLLVDLLPDMAQTITKKAGDIITIAFLAYVTYLSFVMMQQGATRPSPVLRIPFSFVYLATTISFATMTIITSLRLLGFASEPQPESADETL